MGKYENLRDNAFKLTLDAGGREFLEVKKGIGEYNDKIARRFPTMLRPISKAELKLQTVVKEVEEPVVEVEPEKVEPEKVENVEPEKVEKVEEVVETPVVEEEPVIDPEKVIVVEPVLIKESEDKPIKKKRGRKKGTKNTKKAEKTETKK